MSTQHIPVLISEEAIKEKVQELALAISNDYKDKELMVVGILKGSWIFMADLVRKLEKIGIRCDFIKASSYGSRKVTSGKVKLTGINTKSIAGKNILLVEDIIDTGITLKAIKGHLEQFNPQTVKICVFLDKPSRRKVEVEVDYVGFTIPDKFVVGYGLDHAEQFRNLPYVGFIEE
ncbi:MAG: hypoxanthine phosphoribosyltransferase [bacterium]|nr:hypoxanthine phosphoribosyltransferase [bacterium]